MVIHSGVDQGLKLVKPSTKVNVVTKRLEEQLVVKLYGSKAVVGT